MADDNNVNQVQEEDESLPIVAPLKVLDYRTVSKRFGWWTAIVLLESWGRKQLCLYLWQKVGDKWKRKQKFAIHNKADWNSIAEAVDKLIRNLP